MYNEKTIENIKKKVLDLAIRGKLVPQDPNDEPASILVEKIRKEKEKLVKEGKIKPSKNDSIIYKGSDNCYYEKIGDNVKDITKEIPFEIPDSWCWCRLNNLGIYNKGPFGSNLTKDMFVNENTKNRVKVYEQKNAIEKDFSLGHYYISEVKFKEMQSYLVVGGDIIVSCAGTIGEIYELPNEAEKGIINQALMRIKLFYPAIKQYFILYFDLVLKNESNEKGKGTGMKNIPPFAVLKSMLMPIPPENEATRILSKIQHYKKILENIDEEYANTTIIKQQIKNKILNNIFSDNSSYKSYYENRTLTTLYEYIDKKDIGDGDWVLSENMDDKGEYSIIQLKHIGNGEYLEKPYCKINSKFFKDNKCTEIKEGYLLINRLVANKMNVCILPKLDTKAITAVDVCWIAPSNKYNSKYLMYYMLSPCFQNEVMKKVSGSTRKRISKKNLINIPLSIHNIDDQNEIVKYIDNIFDKLDSF